ncbi:MAG: ubiquinol-cytochrome C chaperone, partial [Hyphomicrobiales bacterium]|nr:ubiquinol-cytochrome C chaperone [Hyphomicrobiales bacterium]
MHAAIMAAARRPEFFVEGGVPDEIGGRFEIYALHAGLALRRCAAGGAATGEAGRALADAVFDQFDIALRELGTSDARIAKKMKALGGDLYGRGQAYGAAL